MEGEEHGSEDRPGSGEADDRGGAAFPKAFERELVTPTALQVRTIHPFNHGYLVCVSSQPTLVGEFLSRMHDYYSRAINATSGHTSIW